MNISCGKIVTSIKAGQVYTLDTFENSSAVILQIKDGRVEYMSLYVIFLGIKDKSYIRTMSIEKFKEIYIFDLGLTFKYQVYRETNASH